MSLGGFIAVAFWALVAALVAYGLACDLRIWLEDRAHRRRALEELRDCYAGGEGQ